VLTVDLVTAQRCLDESRSAWAGHARQIVLDGEIAVPDDRGVTRRAPAG